MNPELESTMVRHSGYVVLAAIAAKVPRERLFAALNAMWDELEPSHESARA